MPRTALAIRHLEFENLGLLAPLLAEDGFETSYLDAASAGADWSSAASADLLIVLGGPIGVANLDDYPFLRTELELIERRLASQRPTLGICLGAQLIAVAYGGDVRPGSAAEIGYAPITLTDAARGTVLEHLDGVPVLHWHGDVISTPPELPPLAFTPTCANQAFARGTNVLGLQFHLEAESASFEQWLVGHAYELHAHGIEIRSLRDWAASHASKLGAAARRVFTDWLAGLTLAA
jgi:GMP synthase (glutamine-hydrolysing)